MSRDTSLSRGDPWWWLPGLQAGGGSVGEAGMAAQWFLVRGRVLIALCRPDVLGRRHCWIKACGGRRPRSSVGFGGCAWDAVLREDLSPTPAFQVSATTRGPPFPTRSHVK